MGTISYRHVPGRSSFPPSVIRFSLTGGSNNRHDQQIFLDFAHDGRGDGQSWWEPMADPRLPHTRACQS